MKLITEKEFRDFIKFRDELNKLILAKTTQMSLLLYDRFPKGEYIDCRFSEENRKLFVEFESYSCGESDYDQFYLPIEFLFYETYPEEYKLIWEEEKRKEKEEKERKDEEKKNEERKKFNIWERKEYERLKLKYDNQILDVRWYI